MWIRSSLGALAAGALLLAGGPAAEAAAPSEDGSRVTVRMSDPTPHPGQTVVLRGRYLHDGAVAAGHTVKLQTYRNSEWQQVSGARVRTAADGRYRMRLVLYVKGVRDLRMVGVAGSSGRNSYHRFVMQVK